jgi:hypothetical protein
MDDLLKEMDSFQRATPADRDRRRRFIATTAICALALVGIGQLTTGALFEDAAAATVSYATGDVEIEANGSAAATLTAAANLAPGDTVYRSINVTNVGSLDLRYAISGQTTAEVRNLSNVLRYTVYSGVSNAQCATGTVGGGTALVSNLAIGLASVPVVGSSAPGDQGDITIAAGAPASVLCVAMNLPLPTTSVYALGSATLRLQFDAEQTAHNP